MSHHNGQAPRKGASLGRGHGVHQAGVWKRGKEMRERLRIDEENAARKGGVLDGALQAGRDHDDVSTLVLFSHIVVSIFL